MDSFRELIEVFPWFQDELLTPLIWGLGVVALGWFIQNSILTRRRKRAADRRPRPARAHRLSLGRPGPATVILSAIGILIGLVTAAVMVSPGLVERGLAEVGLRAPALTGGAWFAVWGAGLLILGWLARRLGGGKGTARARWATTEGQRETLAFAADAEAALQDAPSIKSAAVIVVMIGLFASFFGWAYYADMEEVARGEGRVVPAAKTRLVQSLEGGIVKGIEVAVGDVVGKGQVLLRIDNSGFSTPLVALWAKAASLKAQVARLRIEAAGDAEDGLVFPDDFARRWPALIANEQTLYRIRKAALDNQVSLLGDRLEQRRLELAEFVETEKRLQNSRVIAKKIYDLKAPLAGRGAMPKTDLLALERELSELDGRLSKVRTSMPRAEAAIREAERLSEKGKLEFRQAAQAELTGKLSELSVVERSLKAATGRVAQSEIRSPVDGIVEKLHVNTLGGIVGATQPLVEIAPRADNLLVEVKVQPKDIAFIAPGQTARVKLSAYDFTFYGALGGEVALIASDSTVDEATKESYYQVTIKTTETSLISGARALPVRPGMIAVVDIITGSKSILDYLLKPIVTARREALRER